MVGARAVRAGAVSCWIASTSIALAAPSSIERVRHASGPDYTRVVVDVDGPAFFKAAFLQADPARGLPARFFVDLTTVRVDPALKLDRDVGDGRIRRVRVGQHDPGIARIVMELAAPVVPKVFSLDDPPRIVIDLADVVAGRTPPSLAPSPAPPADAAAPSTTRPPAPSRDASAPVATASARVAGPKAPGSLAPEPPPPPQPQPRVAPQAEIRRPAVVVIDPGHGGKDPGASGSGGMREKDVVMDVARRVAGRLRQRLGAQVVLTRVGDDYVSLPERKDVANRANADVFVSIHANASRNRAAHGIETYYLKNTDDRATLRMAKLENGVDLLLKDGDQSQDADLPFILSDMVQGYKEADSILLARYIQSSLVGHVGTRYEPVRDLGVKQGPFYVLDGTYMPSVLVETGFLTNPEESRKVGSTRYRDELAEGIARGIQRYLEDDRVARLD